VERAGRCLPGRSAGLRGETIVRVDSWLGRPPTIGTDSEGGG
jgi:hypothetical protein